MPELLGRDRRGAGISSGRERADRLALRCLILFQMVASDFPKGLIERL